MIYSGAEMLVSERLSKVIWDGEKFIAAGNTIMTSTDGVAWHHADISQTESIQNGLCTLAKGSNLYIGIS